MAPKRGKAHKKKNSIKQPSQQAEVPKSSSPANKPLSSPIQPPLATLKDPVPPTSANTLSKGPGSVKTVSSSHDSTPVTQRSVHLPPSSTSSIATSSSHDPFYHPQHRKFSSSSTCRSTNSLSSSRRDAKPVVRHEVGDSHPDYHPPVVLSSVEPLGGLSDSAPSGKATWNSSQVSLPPSNIGAACFVFAEEESDARTRLQLHGDSFGAELPSLPPETQISEDSPCVPDSETVEHVHECLSALNVGHEHDAERAPFSLGSGIASLQKNQGSTGVLSESRTFDSSAGANWSPFQSPDKKAICTRGAKDDTINYEGIFEPEDAEQSLESSRSTNDLDRELLVAHGQINNAAGEPLVTCVNEGQSLSFCLPEFAVEHTSKILGEQNVNNQFHVAEAHFLDAPTPNVRPTSPPNSVNLEAQEIQREGHSSLDLPKSDQSDSVSAGNTFPPDPILGSKPDAAGSCVGRQHARQCLRTLVSESSIKINIGSEPNLLQIHLSYFDLNMDGQLDPIDSSKALQQLGFNPWTSLLASFIGHGIFSLLMGQWRWFMPDAFGPIPLPTWEPPTLVENLLRTRLRSSNSDESVVLHSESVSPGFIWQKAREQLSTDFVGWLRLTLGYLLVVGLTWPLNLTVSGEQVNGVYNGELLFLMAQKEGHSGHCERNFSASSTGVGVDPSQVHH